MINSSNNKSFIERTLSRLHFDKILHLSDKTFQRFVDSLWIGYECNTLFVKNRVKSINIIPIKIVVLIITVILSKIQYRIMSKKTFSNNNRYNKYICIPFADKVVRYSSIFDILNSNDVSLVYPPVFRYQNLKNHIAHFNLNQNSISISNFAWKDLFFALKKFIGNINEITHVASEFDKQYGLKSMQFVDTVFSYFLYYSFFRRFIKSLVGKKFVWILDYDCDPKYIAINQILKEVRLNDSTIHLQHGMFWDKSIKHFAYFNPISDYDFCCSERELRIISNGMNCYNSKIFAIGCPLQSLIKTVPNTHHQNFDLLILLDSFLNVTNRNHQIEFINTIKDLKYKILVRFRPASRLEDEKYVLPILQNCSFSHNSTLENDILKSQKVISFSGDAAYECFRQNKPLMIFGSIEFLQTIITEDSEKSALVLKSFDSISFDTVTRFMESEVRCEYKKDIYVQNNFGCFDFNDYRKSINNLLLQIWEQ